MCSFLCKSPVLRCSAAMFMFHACMRWLAVWLDLLVVLITTLVALLMVLLAGHVQAAFAGMALSFAIQVSRVTYN